LQKISRLLEYFVVLFALLWYYFDRKVGQGGSPGAFLAKEVVHDKILQENKGIHQEGGSQKDHDCNLRELSDKN
jgi:hypothetical protein